VNTAKHPSGPAEKISFSLLSTSSACNSASRHLLKYSTTMNSNSQGGSNPPNEFLCPISMAVMVDPWTDPASGITYEREAIKAWLIRGKQKCPITRRDLQASSLVPNLKLKRAINEWQQEQRKNGVDDNPDVNDLPRSLSKSAWMKNVPGGAETSLGEELSFDAEAIPLMDAVNMLGSERWVETENTSPPGTTARMATTQTTLASRLAAIIGTTPQLE
jgi:U-box domain